MSDKSYPYQSVLSPYIRDLIKEKRSLGFLYDSEAYELYRFDSYWKSHEKQHTLITYEDIAPWLSSLPGEGRECHARRIQAVRTLTRYMNSLGIPCHVPLEYVKRKRSVIHILSHNEISELFYVIDTHRPFNPKNKTFLRMSKEYPLIYRMYYCCGMRNNEVCSLRTEDVNLAEGILTIRDGKNHKDRLVYMSEDLCILASRYFVYLKNELGFIPRWFFPGKYPDQHISKNHIDKKFGEFWEKTSSSKKCDKKPTPHCLRHTFVVERINRWALEEKDLNVMLDYLSSYLGHRNPEESFYYYHLVDEAFKITRAKDSMASDEIPEVNRS